MARAVQSALPDTVCYSIYPDEQADLVAFRELCSHVVAPLVHGYIWQHQPFDLHPAVTSAASVPHLYGSSRYGDNVEDEWFVVFLLFEISRQVPRASIRVWDTDGEFMLMEAAYALPRWLEPDTSDNRVFIRDSSLHIIPLSSSSSSLALPEALQALVAGDIHTKATDAVQEIIQARIAPCKEQPLHNLHRARCIVPLPVAELLRHEPQLVALAVEAFYDRDVDSMKVAGRMQQFVPDKERVQMVHTVVRMSRAMYAQLVQQVFQAPPCYPMPSLSSPEFKAAELGMKLTCGFEMMYWHHSESAGNALDGDAGWLAYRANLQNSGYFRGLLEGSREHSKLLQAAADHYLATRKRQTTFTPCDRIHEILSLPHDMADFEALDGEGSDDEAWLYNGEENLTRILKERQQEMDAYDEGKKPVVPEDLLTEDGWDPMDVTKTMQAFVEKISTYEGAEVPSRENGDKGGSISMDVKKFMSELKSALNPAEKYLNSEESFSEGSFSDRDDLSGEEGESDDSEDIGRQRHAFLEEYEDALDRELGGSSMQRSFARAEEVLSSSSGNHQVLERSQPATSELAPVDVDTNLLQSLLESYASQEGLPGPASNLLGAMGLSFPIVKK